MIPPGKPFCMTRSGDHGGFSEFLNDRQPERGGKKWLDTDCLACPLLVRRKAGTGVFRPRTAMPSMPVIKVSWNGPWPIAPGRAVPPHRSPVGKGGQGDDRGKYPGGDLPDPKYANINVKTQRPSALFHPTGTACSTWRETSGNGSRTGTNPITIHILRQPARPVLPPALSRCSGAAAGFIRIHRGAPNAPSTIRDRMIIASSPASGASRSLCSRGNPQFAPRNFRG